MFDAGELQLQVGVDLLRRSRGEVEDDVQIHGVVETDAIGATAEAAKEQATARLEAAREAHHLAEDHFARAQSLLATKAIPQAEFDTAEHQERIASVTLRAAEFGHQVAIYELALAQAAFVRTRPSSSGASAPQRLEIFPPVDGKVLRVIRESAGVVIPGQALMEVGNTRSWSSKSMSFRPMQRRSSRERRSTWSTGADIANSE